MTPEELIHEFATHYATVNCVPKPYRIVYSAYALHRVANGISPIITHYDTVYENDKIKKQAVICVE